jgi:DNA-binding NarL/FixJ family response regulator
VIRVLIADDHALVRAGLEQLLATVEDVAVIGSAGDGHEAIETVARHRPDVVLMDLSMPVLDGVAATRAICRTMPSVRVVVLTSVRDRARILDALDAGAIAYVLKDAAPAELIAAVRAAAAGVEVRAAPSVGSFA